MAFHLNLLDVTILTDVQIYSFIIVTDLHNFLLLSDFIMNAKMDQRQYVVSLKREKLIPQIQFFYSNN